VPDHGHTGAPTKPAFSSNPNIRFAFCAAAPGGAFAVVVDCGEGHHQLPRLSSRASAR